MPFQVNSSKTGTQPWTMEKTSTVSSVCRDFIQNTSLLGIQHFLRSKSIVWLVAYLFCVGMSIVQSWSVTVKYFEQQTYHTSSLASKNSLPFPSVTVCTNTVLKEQFDFSKIPGFNTTVPPFMKNCSDWIALEEWIKVKRNNSMAAASYLRKLSNEERLPLGIGIQDFIQTCKFDEQECALSEPKDFNYFSHPYFGNCFTFNPAFEDKYAKEADLQAALFMIIKLNSHDYWLSFNLHPVALIHIHTPGTAPMMESLAVHTISEKDFLMIEVDLKETSIIKKRTTGLPSCVDDTDESYRKRNRYYTNESPYRYSLEACIASCIQDHFGEECEAINAYLPFQSTEYENKMKIGECRLHHAIHMEACDCPIPCNRAEYKTVGLKREDPKIPCEDEHEEPEYPEDAPVGKLATVKIKFRRNIYEKVEELLCYTISDYLGVLGGNISLWIGLCVISLLELVELGAKLIMAAARPSTKIAPPPVRMTPLEEVKYRQMYTTSQGHHYDYGKSQRGYANRGNPLTEERHRHMYANRWINSKAAKQRQMYAGTQLDIYSR